MIFQIDLPVYKKYLLVVIEPFEKWSALKRDHLDNYNPENDPPHLVSALCYFNDNDRQIVIFLRPDFDINDLTHESIHAAWHNMRMCDMHMDDDEHLAYLAGYIANTIYSKFNKRKGVKRNVFP